MFEREKEDMKNSANSEIHNGAWEGLHTTRISVNLAIHRIILSMQGNNIFERFLKFVIFQKKLRISGRNHLILDEKEVSFPAFDMSYRIPKQSLDYGLLPLMSEEDVIKFLKYVPRLREVEVYIETNFSFVDKHLMKRMTSKGKAVLIEEIVDHDVNDVVENELDADSRNSGKIPLVKFNQTSHVGKDGTIVAIDFRVCDSDDEFLPPWSTEKMLEDRTRRRSDEFEFKILLAEIDHEFGLDNSSQDEQDVSNDVDFDDAIFNDVSFDDVDFDVGMDDLDFK
nr:hypothetical protein [Tanacetum cinerariifolium]